MIIHKTTFIQIYFGDAADGIDKAIHCVPTNKPLIAHEKFVPIAQMLNVIDLAFLNQTHSIQGMCLTNQIPAFTSDGDFLITERMNIGIGVITADCLPIVFYDTKNHVAAIAHAGWRGSVAGIASHTMQALKESFHSIPENIEVFLGPSAKKCCYSVANDFAHNVPPYANQVIMEREGRVYFDLPGFNKIQLIDSGINPESINEIYNICTICDYRFFSHRRQPAPPRSNEGGEQKAGRQMTIIALQ